MGLVWLIAGAVIAAIIFYGVSQVSFTDREGNTTTISTGFDISTSSSNQIEVGSTTTLEFGPGFDFRHDPTTGKIYLVPPKGENITLEP